MAFKGLRFARGEIRNNSAGGIMKLVIAAIGVIPLLYGALYLLAFLDPYEQLNTVPVAVVNEDAGAVVNGEFRRVGDEVVDRLRDNHDGLGWQFVDAEQAQEGLESGIYYMTCTIPSEFTSNIASADSDSPEHAQLLINYNETENMLASQIGGTVWKEVRTQVSDAVAKEYWNTVFDKVNDGASQIQEAADGAGELYDGLKDARKGSSTITDNLYTLNNGAMKLNDGLRQLDAGTVQLEDGTGTLVSGANTLKDGTSRLSDGASSLASGTSKLASGAGTLKEGTSKLASGADTLQQGTSSLSSGASQLRKQGTSALASGTSQLEEQTRALPTQKQVKEANDGSTQLTNGIKQLQNAGGKLADGTSALQDGLGTLASSIGSADDTSSETLYGGVNQVIAGLTQLKGDAASGIGLAYAAAGSRQLASQLGDTSALDDGVDELKAGVASLQAGAGQLTDGTAAAEQALGQADTYLSSATTALGSLEGLSDEQQAVVDQALAAIGGAQQYTAGAKDGLEQKVDPGLQQVSDGLGQIDGGLDQLRQQADESLAKASAAAGQIADGLDTAVASIGSTDEEGQTLLYGMSRLKDGLGQVRGGIGSSSDTGSSTLYGGVNQLAAGIGSASDTGSSTLNGGLNNLQSGYNSFSSQILPLVNGAPALRSGIEQINDGAQQVDKNMASVADGASKVNAGAQSLSDGASQVDNGTESLLSGANQLKSGSSQVASGAEQVDSGVASVVSGAQQLASGATQLHDGAVQAQDGSDQIASGSQTLADGSSELTKGLGDAVDGADTLSNGLADGAEGMRVSNAQTRAEVMNDPVQLDESYYTDVKNYGTGFAPYFIALGLWVGSLMTSFVFRPLNKRLILSGGNPAMVAFANYMPFALMSMFQSLLMLVVLQFGLQLQIDHVGLYYAFGILTALVFAAIMQMLTAAFGFPGKFIAIILLMLQLTSAAGTFPIEQTPKFFQTINPFLPMTYVVRGMRQAMTGIDMGVVAQCAGVLALFGIGCFLITTLVARAKRIVTMDDLHPILQLG